MSHSKETLAEGAGREWGGANLAANDQTSQADSGICRCKKRPGARGGAKGVNKPAAVASNCQQRRHVREADCIPTVASKFFGKVTEIVPEV